MARRKKKRKGCLVWFLRFLMLIGLLCLGVGAAGSYFYSKLTTEDLVLEGDGSLIDEEVLAQKKAYNVKNIALFGVDSRQDSYTNTRTDVIMILSYNEDTKEGFITSVPRDTYVSLGSDYGYQKINHAYAYGGAGLAVQTLNRNFDLDIDSYATVNFNAVEGMVNALDGIEVDIQDYEVDEINRVIGEMNEYSTTGSSPYLKTTGIQTLNGKQAVAYMRIRKVGNGDYERMERQRQVMTLVFEKLKTMGLPQVIALANNVLPSVKTNLSAAEILELATSALVGGLTSLDQRQLPETELSYGGLLSDGLYYLVPMTLEDNLISWHEQVYDMKEPYELTNTAQSIHQAIINQTGVY